MPSPIVLATAQATVISSLSNVLAQFLEAYQSEKAFSFDIFQLLRFCICASITAPPNYYWQGYLEKKWPGYKTTAPRLGTKDEIDLAERGDRVAQKEAKPKLNKRNTAIKWFVDCITIGALFNTVGFLFIMSVLKGMDAASTRRIIREQTIPIIVTGYRIWPLASIISFCFIPWQRRIVFFSCVGLFWGIYMSIISARL